MNSIARPITLVGGDLQKGSIRHRFHETIAQRIQDCSACLDCLGLRDVLLGRVANGAIVQYGTSGNAGSSAVNRATVGLTKFPFASR